MKDETKLRKVAQRAQVALGKYMQECRAMTELAKAYLECDAVCEYDNRQNAFVVTAQINGRAHSCPIEVFAQLMHLLGDGEKVTTADFVDACKWHNGFRKQTRKLPKAFNMKILDFDEYNRAHVSEDEFMAYLQQTAQEGDYTKERDEVVYYYNSFGCKLAEYHRNEGWGQTF